MKAYMTARKKNRSWTRIKDIIATLKKLSHSYTTDRTGSFTFTLDIDVSSTVELTDELDTILLHDTDGLSRASFTPKDPYGKILDDRVTATQLRPHNQIDGRYSVSQLIAYQWYYGISVMGMTDVGIRTNLEVFEQTARTCDVCVQKTIIAMRPIFLDLLSLRRDTAGSKRK